ncbi:carbohydrate esterase family 4 protein [Xylariales sp. AK1849]|nr:carbohydrate esterase family 4 protein [Xylariales sp. AK1849]
MHISSVSGCSLVLTLLAVARAVQERPSLSCTRRSNGNTARIEVGDVPYGVIVTACRPGKMALTYDDGPGVFTEELLDILDSNGVKATFFVNGDNGNGPITDAEAGLADIIKETYSAGHQIGSHTFSNADLALLSSEERVKEMIQLEDALSEVIGVVPRYMRPPYTSCEADCVEDMSVFGYHVVNFNIDTKDYLGDYAEARTTFSSALDSADPAQEGFIGLAHDIHAESVHILSQYMIDEAKNHGYELVTLGECLGDPVEDWYREP